MEADFLAHPKLHILSSEHGGNEVRDNELWTIVLADKGRSNQDFESSSRSLLEFILCWKLIVDWR